MEQNSTWVEMNQKFVLQISSKQGSTNLIYIYSPSSHKDATKCLQTKEQSNDPGVCYRYFNTSLNVSGSKPGPQWDVTVTVNSLKTF